MELGLEGKVAIVTGAGRGLGKTMAMALAKEKVRVIICDLNSENAERTQNEIVSLGGKAEAFCVDITKPSEVDDMVDKIEQQYGRIDILVNNACAPIRRVPFMEIDIEEWKTVLNVNMTGTFICSRSVARVMIRQKSGKIINISSFAANIPAAGFSAYSASKAGMEGLSKTLVGELGEYGINVVYIRPGVIETEITKEWHKGEVGEKMMKPIPLQRFGEPSELADLVIFLASEASNYISGGPIPIDGGKLVVQY